MSKTDSSDLSRGEAQEAVVDVHVRVQLRRVQVRLPDAEGRARHHGQGAPEAARQNALLLPTVFLHG